MRSGVIAQKVGMTRVFTDGGEHVPVTVLRLANCQVVAHRTKDKNGYVALQLGSGTRKPKNVEQGRARSFRRRQGRAQAQARRVPRRRERADSGRRRDHRRSFRRRAVRRRDRHLDRQGLRRRHEALEFRAACAPRHGVSISHRSIGSTGGRQDPGKTFKNKKMPGHMGVDRVTTLNLKVVQTDVERGLILVEGAVPGAKGGWITVRDAVKKTLPKDAPKPGQVPAGRSARSRRPTAGRKEGA